MIPLKDRTQLGLPRLKGLARAVHLVTPPWAPPAHCRLGHFGHGKVASISICRMFGVARQVAHEPRLLLLKPPHFEDI